MKSAAADLQTRTHPNNLESLNETLIPSTEAPFAKLQSYINPKPLNPKLGGGQKVGTSNWYSVCYFFLRPTVDGVNLAPPSVPKIIVFNNIAAASGGARFPPSTVLGGPGGLST